jgi:hypothetical protein
VAAFGASCASKQSLGEQKFAYLHVGAGFFEQFAAEGVLDALARLTPAAWE